MAEKNCTRCPTQGRELTHPIDDFAFNHKHRPLTGRQDYCRQCNSEMRSA